MYSVKGLKTPVEVVCSNQFAIYIHEWPRIWTWDDQEQIQQVIQATSL